MATDINMGSIRDLEDFFNKTVSLFDAMIYKWAPILFPLMHRTLIKDAWEEIKNKPILLSNNRRYSFDDLKNDVRRFEDGYCDVKPESIGLAGKQLELKLNCLKEAWNNFEKNGTVFLLKRVLRWINSILGSLLAGVPGIEPLKELKDMMENSIEQNDYR